jgi:hypothetical protein
MAFDPLTQNPYYTPVDPEQQIGYREVMRNYAQNPALLDQLASSRGLEDQAAQLSEQQKLADNIRGVPPSMGRAAGLLNGINTGLINGMNLYRSGKAYRERPGVMDKLGQVQRGAMGAQVAPYAPGAALGQKWQPGMPDPVAPPPDAPAIGQESPGYYVTK